MAVRNRKLLGLLGLNSEARARQGTHSAFLRKKHFIVKINPNIHEGKNNQLFY